MSATTLELGEDLTRVLETLEQPLGPSGSAMPLVWAHAEYLKLKRSLRDGLIFDQPPQTVERYLKQKTVSPRMSWRFNPRFCASK
ncbi:MAG: hypothetical protein M3Y07_08595 [Acidobacteriota bacterium]|nr:hypothetical protein [Acidobacteriota bacterium]